MASKNRKTIIFSSKNTDLYEHLVEMQTKGDNVSEYLCNLIRADLEMTVNKEDFNEIKTQVQKLDKIEEMLSELMKNGVAINPANEEQEEELANIDTITVSDEEMELQDDNDVNDLLNMFADMEGMEA
jgi:predicted CopG family antitoxin